jgi:pimeloyl-ACP methyl ester carboxylesterase
MTTTTAQKTDQHRRSVHANRIDIHYVETGSGDPLILLHGGLVSTSDLWAPTPISYSSYLERLGQRFRVIAPDARTSGRTRHTGGPVSASLLADDVAALITALGLEHPAVAGFSEGGLTALLLGIRHPSAVGAIVCDAGYDVLNPDAPPWR